MRNVVGNNKPRCREWRGLSDSSTRWVEQLRLLEIERAWECGRSGQALSGLARVGKQHAEHQSGALSNVIRTPSSICFVRTLARLEYTQPPLLEHVVKLKYKPQALCVAVVGDWWLRGRRARGQSSFARMV